MENLTYQAALQELQTILAELQEQQVSIDELGARSQRAAQLIAFCQDKLRQTETTIQSLFPEEDVESED